jgi:chemotaxis protein CheZ
MGQFSEQPVVDDASPFANLVLLSDRLKQTSHDKLSLPDIISIAEMLTSSLQPLLRRIDSTIQRELRGILGRIEGLRTEIAKVRADDITNIRIPEMGRELHAVVESTETATNTIMAAAEAVLGAEATDLETYKQLVSDKMMEIFEACSFQDITGQRVTKVVETVEVIEERINLLCGMLAQNNVDAGDDDALSERDQRKKDLILNGPAHAGEGVDQADIDKFF